MKRYFVLDKRAICPLLHLLTYILPIFEVASENYCFDKLQEIEEKEEKKKKNQHDAEDTTSENETEKYDQDEIDDEDGVDEFSEKPKRLGVDYYKNRISTTTLILKPKFFLRKGKHLALSQQVRILIK